MHCYEMFVLTILAASTHDRELPLSVFTGISFAGISVGRTLSKVHKNDAKNAKFTELGTFSDTSAILENSCHVTHLRLFPS